MKKKKKPADPLIELLAAARPETLSHLIAKVAKQRPDLRRECLEYLKEHTLLSNDQKRKSDGQIILALWGELCPDLEDLDSSGGGDYGTSDHVSSLLYDIQESLGRGKIEANIRRELLEEVLQFIKSGNAGLDDELYAVAHAACYTDEESRDLARAFEGMQRDWPIDHARRIYRKLDLREDYLRLRRGKLVYGLDYYDLATFYWEEGNHAQALAVAEEGLKKGQGRVDELREFLANRAREGGDRKKYLELQFAQASDLLTLSKYERLKKICSPGEWKNIEPRLLQQLKHTWRGEQLKIRMRRKEYEEAIGVLLKGRYPVHASDSEEELRTAAKLETGFPEEILAYYLTGFDNLNFNASRKEYAQRAKVMAKVHHVLVDILKGEDRWKEFAGKIKQKNLRRPAFQEEFLKVVPGWSHL